MGTTPKGRFVAHAAVDPENDKRIFLATGEGVYISEDGGFNFLKTTKKGVGEGFINWIYFNPYDSRYVFVGTDYGLMRSRDRGKNWEWAYFTTFPDARIVRSIVVDPHDKRSGYIATHDGLFSTPDILEGGLESWKRMGGLALTGMETSRITACPRHKGHLWTLTNMKLNKPDQPLKHDTGGAFIYESLDGGDTWKVIFSGNTVGSMQWYAHDSQDPDLLWIGWSRGLYRMRRRPADFKEKHDHVIPDDPTMSQVFTAALRYTGVEPGLQLDYRFLSRIQALVPKVNLYYAHYRWNDFALMKDAAFPFLPFKIDEGYGTSYDEFRVMLVWDLRKLVFNLEASFFGRLSRVNGEIWGFLMNAIQRNYGELRRLRMLMRNEPPGDLRVRLMYKLRIEELTSYVDLITGGYLTRWKRGDHPDPMLTEWWRTWKETRK
jgi:hypothetical protein